MAYEIIQECKCSKLIKLEQEYIDALNPYFNIRMIADSNRGIKRSKKTKERIRQANLGKKLSKGTKLKMAERMKGNKYTEGIIPVNAKKVVCIKTKKVFDKIEDAANYIGMKRTTLNAQLNGQNKNNTTLKYL